MIAPTSQTLERAVRRYVAEGSGLEKINVIPGQVGGPSPTGPYATVLLIDEAAEGQEWTRDERVERAGEPTADVTSYESVRVDWSVQWFRKGARDLARTFRFWAQSPLGVQAAAERGLTLYRTSGVRQLDAIISEAWEERGRPGPDARLRGDARAAGCRDGR